LEAPKNPGTTSCRALLDSIFPDSGFDPVIQISSPIPNGAPKLYEARTAPSATPSLQRIGPEPKIFSCSFSGQELTGLHVKPPCLISMDCTIQADWVAIY